MKYLRGLFGYYNLIDQIKLLSNAFKVVKAVKPYKALAMIVLPDHIHTIWKLPDNDSDYSGRWQRIKREFTNGLNKQGVKLTFDKRGEYQLWQRRYWEHTIRDENDLQRHIDYIHYNPVKHGLVKTVIDWPYSSFHNYVSRGILTKDWGKDVISHIEGDFGE